MLTLILRRFLLLCMLPSYATAPSGKREMDMPCTIKATSCLLTVRKAMLLCYCCCRQFWCLPRSLIGKAWPHISGLMMTHPCT